MKLLLLLGIVLLAIAGCATSRSDAIRVGPDLSGVWRESETFANFVTLRKNDGTYLSKGMQRYDLAKPPAFITSKGRWKVTGDQFIITPSWVSDNIWQSSIGKEIVFEILKIDPKILKYQTPDGGIVTETKTGPATDKTYNRMTVESLISE